MKRLFVTGILIGCTLVSLGEPFEKKPPPGEGHGRRSRGHRIPRAWLGLQVSKPDNSIMAQLPSLPPGIGFVIRSVEEGGPAEAAGLQEFDVLWKIGDQMLVNEGQLATLLRLSQPGDEVALAGFRGGKELLVTVKLTDTPKGRHPIPGHLVDSAILPGECEGPMRIIMLSEKVASFSADEGRAKVWRDGPLYKARITGPKDEVIYEGELPANGSLDAVPQDWKRRVHALRRGLNRALEGDMMAPRQPRPRVVPPPKDKR